MTKSIVLFTVFITLGFTINCFGETRGFKLILNCSEAEKFLMSTDYEAKASLNTVECLSEIAGFRNGVIISQMQYNRNKKPSLGAICFPENISTTELNSILLKWLNNNPEKWHQQNILLMWNAFSDYFPCGSK